MTQTLTEIVEELMGADKKVQLIYAFNGTGKTRLSRKFKERIDSEMEEKEMEADQPKILYYNAFTEDLFSWDNDIENDIDLKLTIKPNNYTQWILQEQGYDKHAIDLFQRYASDKIEPHFSSNFSEVIFSFRGNDTIISNVKISKGEESIFIWSIFYSLLEVVIGELNVSEANERETDRYDRLEYVFIDDPVTSLDENHLIELAVDLAKLIKSSESALRFIITTHSPLFYNVVYNELRPSNCYLLEKLEDGSSTLTKKDGDSNTSFSYHLYLMQILEKAVTDDKIEKFHFMLLRNLYEKTARFLGYREWKTILPGDNDTQKAYANRIINLNSHDTLSTETRQEPTLEEKKMVGFLLRHLQEKYNYRPPQEEKHHD